MRDTILPMCDMHGEQTIQFLGHSVEYSMADPEVAMVGVAIATVSALVLVGLIYRRGGGGPSRDRDSGGEN